MRLVLASLVASGCVTSIDVARPATVTESANAPAFTLPSHTGATVVLGDLLAKGPVALVFYRGHW